MTRTGDIRTLDTLAPGGVLILDRNRRALMTRAKLDALFNWVGKGGYLIAVPEEAGMPDPILEKLHVHWEKRAEQCGCRKKAKNQSGIGHPASAPVAAPAPAEPPEPDPEPDPDTIFVQIPGAGRTLEMEPQDRGLKAGDREPEWQVARGTHGDSLIHYRHGKGNITLIPGLDRIVANDSVGDLDHAEFFWTLLQRYQPGGPVTLMTRLPVPDLFDWLVQNAWTALLATALLIALWLWRIIPRFGPMRADAPRSRRELREHLNAIGRFVWRREGFARWLEVARASFRERLALRHPAIAALPYPDQAAALAKLTSRPRQAILSALAGSANNASEFTAILRMLKNLKHEL
jgi:hypothetical protein